MPLANAIIIKELIQGSHRRRLYVLRATLAGLAIMIVAPRIAIELTRGAQNWRALSEIARPIFETCSWMQLIVFSVLAAGLSGSCLGIEWQRKTIEILCATPISFTGIVYGKFASVLGKIFVIGLALLPVQAIYVYIGRIPTVTVLRGLGVVVAATVLFGGLSLLQGAVFTKHNRWGGLRVAVALLYLAVAIAVCVFLSGRMPALAALVPFWSFSFCLAGTAPGGMTPGVYAALAIVVPLGIGGLALVATPFVFRASFMRHIGATGSARRRWFARRTVRRPPMKAAEHPFSWQERGRTSRFLRWSVVAAFGVTVAGVIAVDFFYPDPIQAIAANPIFYKVLLVIGSYIVVLQTAYFSAGVFAREKLARTAQALVLTGVNPRAFLFHKAKALLRAQWPAMAALVACAVAVVVTTRFAGIPGDSLFGAFGPFHAAPLLHSNPIVVVAGVVGIPFAVISVCVPALVLSCAARTPGQAVGALLVAMLLQALSCLTLVAGGIVLAVYAGMRRPWTLWRLAVLLAITSIAISLPLSLVGALLRGWGTAIVAPVFAGLHAFLWYRLGAGVFDRCMLDNG